MYALVAYIFAIVLKEVLQTFTAASVIATFGSESVVTGLYFGLQTSFFEVGLAFAVAWYFASQKRLFGKDAEAYGLGLSFAENGLLLGVLPLINLIAYYSVLSSNTTLASTLYAQLLSGQPSLFYSTSRALPLVGFGILERVSSLLIHFSWGYLAVISAFYRKRRYFLLAFPMGLVDALVPFAPALGLGKFEAVIFGISVIALVATIVSTRNLVRTGSPKNPPSSQVSDGTDATLKLS